MRASGDDVCGADVVAWYSRRMRPPIDTDTFQKVRQGIGRAATSAGRVYFTGGVTALAHGWRASTLDVDLSMGPEPGGVFSEIAALKRRLGVNIEIVSPADFVPALPGWESRSVFIERIGQVDFFHFDPYTQALSKLARGFDRDFADASSMVKAGLVAPRTLESLFHQVGDELLRYPGLDADSLARAVATFAEQDEAPC